MTDRVQMVIFVLVCMALGLLRVTPNFPVLLHTIHVPPPNATPIPAATTAAATAATPEAVPMTAATTAATPAPATALEPVPTATTAATATATTAATATATTAATASSKFYTAASVVMMLPIIPPAMAQVVLDTHPQESIARIFLPPTDTTTVDRLLSEMDIRLPDTPHHDTLDLPGVAAVNANGDVRPCPDNRPNWADNSNSDNEAVTTTVSNGDHVIPSLGCAPAALDPLPSCADGAAYEKVIVISQYWGEGYFHFMIEDLPRLFLAAQYLEKHGLDANEWHVHAIRHQHEAVGMLGFTKPMVSGNIRVTERLLVPPSTPCGGYRKDPQGRMRSMGAFLRSRTPPLVGPPLVRAAELVRPAVIQVLVIQRVGGQRSILNHEDLVQHLRTLYSTVVVHTGAEPFADQLALFAAAEAVVGPHGAGMSNIVATPPPAAIVELLPVLGANNVNPCYMLLAYHMGHSYAAHYDAQSHASSSWDTDVRGVAETLVAAQAALHS